MLKSTHVNFAHNMSSAANDASAMWVAALRLRPRAHKHWMVAIVLDAVEPRGSLAGGEANTQLHIEIDSSEWGIWFCHGKGLSSIRVMSVPFVHERDDFELLPHVTELRKLGVVVRLLERRFRIWFRRPHAAIHTNLADAQQKILLWVVSAL